MLSKELGMLNHGAFERLKDDPSLAQFIRQSIALQQLVVGKNHPAAHLIKSARPCENLGAHLFRKDRGLSEGREIETVDAGEAPWLILAHGHGHPFETLPCAALLLPKPFGKIRGIGRAGQDRARFGFPCRIQDS
jgi:hypothetical protein